MDYLQYKKMYIWIEQGSVVLNLVIRGIPSIQNEKLSERNYEVFVLNLIITGIPSIL